MFFAERHQMRLHCPHEEHDAVAVQCRVVVDVDHIASRSTPDRSGRFRPALPFDASIVKPRYQHAPHRPIPMEGIPNNTVARSTPPGELRLKPVGDIVALDNSHHAFTRLVRRLRHTTVVMAEYAPSCHHVRRAVTSSAVGTSQRPQHDKNPEHL